MKENLPLYKRTAIWFTFAGAMIVGALLLFGKWIRWNLFRVPMTPPVSNDREIMDQKIEDEIKTIDRQIEAMDHESGKKYVSRDKTIIGVNADLSKARELRRAKRELAARLGDRGTDRRDDRND